MRRFGAILALLCVASILTVPAVTAAPAPDLVVRSWPDEAGLGVIDPAGGSSQLLRVDVKPGRAAYPEFAVRNTGSVQMTVRVTGEAGGPRAQVTYRDEAWHDVTDEVVAGTFELDVPKGKERSITAEMRVSRDLDTGPVRTLWVEVESARHGLADRAGLRVDVPPLRVWGTDFNGTLRCEATFPHRFVRPGDLTGVSMRVTNLTDGPRSAYTIGTLVIRDADGRLLDDTDDLLRYGPLPRPIDPGETVDAWSLDTRVRWPGELSVRPRCAGIRLPQVRLQVVPSDMDVGAADAIQRAVAVPGSPFQECPPGPQGEPATGVLTTPDGRKLPPMTVRCWAEVRDEDGFATVDLYMVSPDDQPAYELGESPFESDPPIPDEGPNMFAARWSFVVTPHRVRPWRSVMRVHALGEGTAYEYELQDGEWRSGGYGTCGFDGYFQGFLGDLFLLDWYTRCDPGAMERGAWVATRLLTTVDDTGEVRTRTLP